MKESLRRLILRAPSKTAREEPPASAGAVPRGLKSAALTVLLPSLSIFAALALFVFSGCAEHERREIRVEEEQHPGEVVEDAPGEMIVE